MKKKFFNQSVKELFNSKGPTTKLMEYPVTKGSPFSPISENSCLDWSSTTKLSVSGGNKNSRPGFSWLMLGFSLGQEDLRNFTQRRSEYEEIGQTVIPNYQALHPDVKRAGWSHLYDEIDYYYDRKRNGIKRIEEITTSVKDSPLTDIPMIGGFFGKFIAKKPSQGYNYERYFELLEENVQKSYKTLDLLSTNHVWITANDLKKLFHGSVGSVRLLKEGHEHFSKLLRDEIDRLKLEENSTLELTILETEADAQPGNLQQSQALRFFTVVSTEPLQVKFNDAIVSGLNSHTQDLVKRYLNCASHVDHMFHQGKLLDILKNPVSGNEGPPVYKVRSIHNDTFFLEDISSLFGTSSSDQPERYLNAFLEPLLPFAPNLATACYQELTNVYAAQQQTHLELEQLRQEANEARHVLQNQIDDLTTSRNELLDSLQQMRNWGSDVETTLRTALEQTKQTANNNRIALLTHIVTLNKTITTLNQQLDQRNRELNYLSFSITKSSQSLYNYSEILVNWAANRPRGVSVEQEGRGARNVDARFVSPSERDLELAQLLGNEQSSLPVPNPVGPDADENSLIPIPAQAPNGLVGLGNPRAFPQQPNVDHEEPVAHFQGLQLQDLPDLPVLPPQPVLPHVPDLF